MHIIQRGLAPFVLALFLSWGFASQPAYGQQPSEVGPSEVGPYLQEVVQLAEEALAASREAERAETVAGVKAGAETTFQAVWGLPSGLSEGRAGGASNQHGWKTRWQTTPAAFDSAFAARYGTAPPEVTDVQELGILGRGLHVRRQFAVAPDSAGPDTPGLHYSHESIVAPLSNAIGWMRMDNGITKGELQPRVDLTYQWDAPPEFWKSTADTGWLHEAYAQALNILKTNYEGDVEMAREHAAGMTALLEKALDGVDADNNRTVEPVMMEGGLRAALQEAESAGLISQR